VLKSALTIVPALLVAALSASAQDLASRTDNDAAIPSGAIPLPLTLGTPPACPFTINGTLGTGSPEWPSTTGQQPGRLTRDGVASTCPTPGPCVIFATTGNRQFDAYTFVNTTGLTRCVSVGLNVITQTNCNLWVVGYLNAFDQNNMCTNYIGDTGSSSSIPPVPVAFDASVPAGASLVLVVQDSNVATCVAGVYDLSMTGECLPVELQKFGIE
jgi:hypothetical protein